MEWTPEIGLINAMSPLSVVLCSFPASAFGARWGRRMGTAVGLTPAVLGSSALVLAEAAPAALESGAILISYLVVGAGMALYMINVTPFLLVFPAA
ncbi:MAG: hypothetical protein JXA89_15115 [Anaerolineae bacterium]|nr:hypothetical protein [Anaerolineae bacterium]